MELEVYNVKGEKTTKTVVLKDEIFNITPNDHAIYLDVKQILANRRQGTHSSLEKSVVSGSTRKLKRQKGTGGARSGSIKNPLFRGGARVFGPTPRDYGFKLNKKLKKLARLSALTYKAKENGITIIEDFTFDAPKTKQVAELLNNFNAAQKRVLFVMPRTDQNVILSARNLKNAKVINANSLNTYDIMHANTLFVLESSLPSIESLFNGNQE